MKHLYSYSLFLLFLVFCFSCAKPKEEIREPYKLSDITDSVVYEDLKFGITRNDLLKRFSNPPQQNIMSEPIFDTDVVEVEGRIDIKNHHFITYYYFDPQDSLYRVAAEFRSENINEYEKACRKVAYLLYIPYGIPKKWKTIQGSYKFSWDLKNKQIFLECGCFMNNCLLEVMTTEIRLFIKNRDRIIPGVQN